MICGFIGIGSNIDRGNNLVSAAQALTAEFGKLTLSSVYESAAVGFIGPAFYNLVAGFQSSLPAFEVAAKLRAIEFTLGRPLVSQKFSSRSLDLDLLLYGDQIITTDGLQLPRPDIIRYAFVLEPLAEIAPDLPHPVLGISFKTLWTAMAATLAKEQQQRIDFAFPNLKAQALATSENHGTVDTAFK